MFINLKGFIFDPLTTKVGTAARRSGFLFFAMRPHTFSTVTLNDVKRCKQGIFVTATYCQNYGKKSDYRLLIKDAPNGLDLRMSGEKDLLCILFEQELNRIWSQKIEITEMVTNCCSGKVYHNTQICKICGEHSELVASN